MSRIRTIKPEFPQSQKMGKVSREARYLFVMLWTIADDDGRTRAASRMLASLLYPYDDDAKGLMDGWLGELESVGSIRRYVVDSDDYLEITNWLKHQKIDRPSKSKLPSFDEASLIVASPREASSTDLVPGPSTLDLGPSSLRSVRADESAPRLSKVKIKRQIPDDWKLTETLRAYAAGLGVDAEKAARSFAAWHKAKGDLWKDWDACFQNWCRQSVEMGRDLLPAAKAHSSGAKPWYLEPDMKDFMTDRRARYGPNDIPTYSDFLSWKPAREKVA